MGDYADDAMDRDFDNMANSMFHDNDFDDDDVDFRHPTFNNDCPYVKKFSETTISFKDIKQTTAKAILIRLGWVWVDKEKNKFDSEYVWIPIKEIEIDYEKKEITAPNWLLAKKNQEIRNLLCQKIEKRRAKDAGPVQTSMKF